MSMDETQVNESEIDRRLAVAEKSPVGQMLRTARLSLEPRHVFVQGLESSLQAVSHQPCRVLNPRPFAWASACAIVLLIIGSVVWLNLPTPVSAQQVLDRAAAPQMVPNQIAHRTYKMEQPGHKPATSTGDVWVQADARGAVSRTAFTFTGFNSDGTVLSITRVLVTGGNVQEYDYMPGDNTVNVITGTFDQVMGDKPNYFDGASVAKYLTKVAQGNVQNVHLLPPQTLDGVPVQVLNDKGDEGTNYYFDAQSYILRGIEAPGMRVWLAKDETVAAKDMPSDAFAFNPPANARVVIPPKKTQGGGNVQLDTLLDVCHLSQAALDAGQAGKKTPLEICQSGVPDMTQSRLVAALLVPLKAQWDADLAAGKITPAQEAEMLANAEKKTGIWVTIPLER